MIKAKYIRLARFTLNGSTSVSDTQRYLSFILSWALVVMVFFPGVLCKEVLFFTYLIVACRC